MTGPELRVEFCGEEYAAAPDASLTFGRSADLNIDDNRFLHRVLGEFQYSNGMWWLSNVGTSIALNLHDEASNSYARIAPGSQMPIAFDTATIRFDAGGTSYEVTVDVLVDRDNANDDLDRADSVDDEGDETDQEATTTTASLPLTDEQRELLEALAAPILIGESLPTNRQLAHQLGWTITKYNRKLDGLCSKYAKGGVAGLRGSAGELAKDRRLRLAEHAVNAGIVSAPPPPAN